MLDTDFLTSLESALSTDLQLMEESIPYYYTAQDCDQDLEMDFDMIPNWPGGPDTIAGPSDVSIISSSLFVSKASSFAGEQPGWLVSSEPWYTDFSLF